MAGLWQLAYEDWPLFLAFLSFTVTVIALSVATWSTMNSNWPTCPSNCPVCKDPEAFRKYHRQ